MRKLVIEKAALKQNLAVIKEKAAGTVIYGVLTGDGGGIGIVRLASAIYRYFTVAPTDTIDYFDALSGEAILPPTIPELALQALLTAVPVYLCVLVLRGFYRPVRKGSLAAAGVCLIAVGGVLLLCMLFFLRFGALYFILMLLSALLPMIAAVLMMAEKGKNIVVVSLLAAFLLVIFVLSVMMRLILPVNILSAAAAALGGSAVRLASQDAKMA